jgi:hypothetical protein
MLERLACEPSVRALLRLARYNVTVLADVAAAFDPDKCGRACALDEEEEAGPSFLQAGLTKQVPKNRHFQLRCQCDGDIVMRPSRRLTINLPLGSCTANKARVTRIFTPGCAANASVCSDKLSALDARLEQCFSPRRAWTLNWARVREHHFSDFSGWTQQPVLGAPGGDLGEFLLALAVYEGRILKPLDPPTVKSLLRRFLAGTKKKSFYFSTDRNTLQEVTQQLSLDSLDLRMPPAGIRTRLLNELTTPGGNGCRYFRYMLTWPGEFEVRRELVASTIVAFFQLLWDRDDKEQLWARERLVVLNDVQREEAVVFVRSYQECLDYGIAPLVPPQCGTLPIAVLHKQAAGEMREELAEWVATLLPLGSQVEHILAAIQSLAEHHSQTTMRHAFEGKLPIYDVSFEVSI